MVPTPSLRIEQFNASFAGAALKLEQPTTFQFNIDAVAVDELALAIPDDGQLRLRGSASSTGASIDAELHKFALRLLDPMTAIPIADGYLDLNVSARTGVGAPRLDIRGQLQGVHLRGVPAEVPPFAGALNANWDGQSLAASASLKGAFEPPLTAWAKLPLRLNDGPLPAFITDRAVRGALLWHGAIEPLFAVVPAPDHLLAGNAQINVQVTGTLDNP